MVDDIFDVWNAISISQQHLNSKEFSEAKDIMIKKIQSNAKERLNAEIYVNSEILADALVHYFYERGFSSCYEALDNDCFIVSCHWHTYLSNKILI